MAFDRMKVVYSALCFCFFLKIASCQVRVGKTVDDIIKYPYQAFLEIYYRNQAQNVKTVNCGGTVLNQNYILTAAHCVDVIIIVDNMDYTRFDGDVYLGMLKIEDYLQRLAIDNENVLIHTRFQRGNFNNADIALITTHEPMRIDNFRIARGILGNIYDPIQPGWECDLTGYGPSTTAQMVTNLVNPRLMFGETIIMNDDSSDGHCSSNLHNSFGNGNEICCQGDFSLHRMWPRFQLSTELAPASTGGDSGGPMSCYPQSRPFYKRQQKYVYGVSSFSTGERGHRGSLSYYTDIAPHIELILRGTNDILLAGRDAALGQFPYQVAIFRNFQHKCSGTILSKDWVLAVSGCFQVGQEVIAGEVDLQNIRETHVNLPRQRRTCANISTRGSVEMCKMNKKFNLNWNINLVEPVQPNVNYQNVQQLNQTSEYCMVASWEITRTGNHHNYLRWKEVDNFRLNRSNLVVTEYQTGFTNTVALRTGTGAGLVCSDSRFEKKPHITRKEIFTHPDLKDAKLHLVGVNLNSEPGNNENIYADLTDAAVIQWITGNLRT